MEREFLTIDFPEHDEQAKMLLASLPLYFDFFYEDKPQSASCKTDNVSMLYTP